jgi:hypothetical protein
MPVMEAAAAFGAALCQDLTLGGPPQGIRVVDEARAGGWWD